MLPRLFRSPSLSDRNGAKIPVLDLAGAWGLSGGRLMEADEIESLVRLAVGYCRGKLDSGRWWLSLT